MTIRNLFIISILSCLSGCSGEDASVKNLTNLNVFDLETVPVASLVKDATFKGNEAIKLGEVGAVAADASGSVYLVDEYRSKIQVFDSTGTYSGSIGRAGARPGEFQQPAMLRVVDNQLMVYDEFKQEVSMFGLEDHSLIRSVRFELPDSVKSDRWPNAVMHSAAPASERRFLVSFQSVSAPDDRTLHYFVFDENGQMVAGPLMSFPNKNLTIERSSIVLLPFERETLIETDTEGTIYAVNTGELLVKVYDMQGTYQSARSYPFTNKKLNLGEAVDLFTDVDMRRAIRGADLPDTWPAVANLLIDDTNRLWVATINSDLKLYNWFGIERDGTPFARFSMPRHKELRAVKGGFFYTKEFNRRYYTDEVIRYKMVINK